MRVLVIPDPPELRGTPRPNRKAARSRDTYYLKQNVTL